MLTSEETEAIFHLAEQLIGSSQKREYRRDILISNVERRMGQLGFQRLQHYLLHVEQDQHELSHLLSALTIHTTSWFRENPHFDFFRNYDYTPWKEKESVFRMLCVGCSTGQEVYSFAMVLEEKRRVNPNFNYEILGLDVDPLSVATGRQSIYSLEELPQVDHHFHRFVKIGQGRAHGLFTIDRPLRDRCHFVAADIRRFDLKPVGQFDAIVCRNILIYFDTLIVEEIIRKLLTSLNSDGILCLGHSEAIEGKRFGASTLGHALYKKQPQSNFSTAQQSFADDLPSILIIDDSPTVRKVVSELLSRSFRVHSVSGAPEATEFLATKEVDIITLDLHMPDEDGLTWLQAQRSRGLKTPVVIISDATQKEAIHVLGALEKGAQDFFEKSHLRANPTEVVNRLRAIEQQARQSRMGKSVSPHRSGAGTGHHHSTHNQPMELIVAGASTGGTDALTRLFRSLPPNTPPLVFVQHISRNFARPFADRLAAASGLQLGLCQDGEKLQPGKIYAALGDHHICVEHSGRDLVLRLRHDPPVKGHRPSVDTLFRSAEKIGSNVIGIILTGMGTDGAQGLMSLKNKGCLTCAQDESSCVVFGMPREAIAIGAATFVGSLESMRDLIVRTISHCNPAILTTKGA